VQQSWITPHIPARSNDQLVLHIANVWLASQGYQWDKRLEQIGAWKGGRFARPQYSQGQAIIGLFPFIVANMITGPNATPVSEWRWTNMTTIISITPLDRYCMAIPLMQAIWAVADLDGEMRNVTWKQRYEQQNLKAWFQHLQKKVKNNGIYDVQWVLNECQNNATLVPQEMMQGVSVQVAKVLYYLRSDFAYPPREALWYCSLADRNQMEARILYHPNPPVPDGGGAPQPVPLPRFRL
jgi:hypothetical protein